MLIMLIVKREWLYNIDDLNDVITAISTNVKQEARSKKASKVGSREMKF